MSVQGDAHTSRSLSRKAALPTRFYDVTINIHFKRGRTLEREGLDNVASAKGFPQPFLKHLRIESLRLRADKPIGFTTLCEITYTMLAILSTKSGTKKILNRERK